MLVAMALLAQSATDYFPLAKGNRWCYKIYYQYETPEDACIEVTGAEGKTFTLEGRDETQTIRVSGDSIVMTERVSDAAVLEGKEIILVGLPEQGASWDWDQAGGTARITGKEDLSVPAGDFSCIVIKRKRSYVQGPLRMSEEMTEWWAKGVGLVRRERTLKTGEGFTGWVWELTKYSVKGK